jgi:pyruvate,orthophosphate dikinase
MSTPWKPMPHRGDDGDDDAADAADVRGRACGLEAILRGRRLRGDSARQRGASATAARGAAGRATALREHLYRFGAGVADGDATAKETLGGKGAVRARVRPPLLCLSLYFFFSDHAYAYTHSTPSLSVRLTVASRRVAQGLAAMSNLGLNVPPGFTISTDACERYAREAKEADCAKKGTAAR